VCTAFTIVKDIKAGKGILLFLSLQERKLIAYDKKQNHCTIENLDTNKLFW
jgi:hypothetical protein